GLQELARAQDDRGTWWAAALTDYLGSRIELWYVQSRHGKQWEKPAYAADLDPFLDHVLHGKLTCRGGELALQVEGERSVPNGLEFAPVTRDVVTRVDDLYLDSDGDSLPDRLERKIGTDPSKPDSNGNGIPDGEDRNPLYRAHALRDEEGIYAAAIQGVCDL